jgi:hypothetical protein
MTKQNKRKQVLSAALKLNLKRRKERNIEDDENSNTKSKGSDKKN